MLGDIYVNEELYDAAVGAYLRGHEADGGADVERPLRNAKVLAARGALAQTRELVAWIEQNRTDVMEDAERKDLLKLRARLAVAGGAGDEEARVLEEIVELDPLDGEALILLGRHSARNEDPEKAMFYFERAAGIDEFEAEAKLAHAQLLSSQHRYTEALPLLRRAQQLKPRDNVQDFLDQVEKRAKAR